MKTVGFIGWRGMVGSVLMDRMIKEQDFKMPFEPVFFSTSQVDQLGPDINGSRSKLKDAMSIPSLLEMDIIVTAQGGDYTNEIYPQLKSKGWNGYWIDAASALRMDEDSVIILDPVNRQLIDQALDRGIKKFIGGNCTVSLMLMALGGLFNQDLVEWLSSHTYQAASGGGARHMKELISQMGYLHTSVAQSLQDPAIHILDIDKKITAALHDSQYPKEMFMAPLAGSLIPYIDRPMENGQSREEWKAAAEGNKILGHKGIKVPIDGTCVRMGAMRCHSQAFTIKLKKELPLDEVEQIIKSANPWVKLIANTKEDSSKYLTPAAVSGTLEVPIGRLRKMNLGSGFYNAFSVGDQLLWGAAEPLRRMLTILLG